MSSSAFRIPNTSIAANFADFFAALNGGRKPFPWQQRLAAQIIADSEWPQVIELPTASGKTAVIDVWVFALALGCASRRLFFTIDRRIVVDQAHDHAMSIAGLLAEALEQRRSGILEEVARALANLGGDVPLYVSRMRGGVYRDMRWARSPHQPTVCVTTVDQLGSRLLNRGYSLRDRALPIHTGLVGNDSLIILDEVHISEPFEQTLTAIQRYQAPKWSTEPLARPLQAVRMSATPRRTGEKIFTLGADDLSHPLLGKRIAARKWARLDKPAPTRHGMISEICHEAHRLMSQPRPPTIIAIVVNRVATARAVFEQLKGNPVGNSESDVILLTGRARPYERDHLIEQIVPHMLAGRERKTRQKPIIVVATQCIEVGADFDFDALITECAPLDALRQRLGRLDRLGELGESPAIIVANKEDLNNDRVYGAATKSTWKYLNEHLKKPKRTRQAGLDLGTIELDARLAALSIETHNSLRATIKPAPVLLPAHLDLFAQTTPIPAADPEPALFLHGEAALPDVQVVWRGDLDPGAPSSWAECVALLPPKREEALAIPISAARAFLSNAQPADIADTEGGIDFAAAAAGNLDVQALLWRGEESEVIQADALRPGDTIVVPASYGGCDGYGWNPESRATTDIADLVASQRRNDNPVLRIHPALIADSDVLRALRVALDAIADDESNKLVEDAIESCLNAIGESKSVSDAQRHFAERLAGGEFKWTLYPTGSGVLVESVNAVPIETDEDETACEGRRITLATHSRGVREYARQFGEALALPTGLIADLALAGWLHDIGKSDPRCQMWLYGSELELLKADGLLLAKSGMPQNIWDEVRTRSGYPKGYRHECESVALAQSNPDVLAQARDLELVLYLISTHHGLCRPFAPAIPDPEPVKIQLQHGDYAMQAWSDHGLQRIDSAAPERFWMLLRKYGWWGLAYLEAILRLADWRQSQDERDGKN